MSLQHDTKLTKCFFANTFVLSNESYPCFSFARFPKCKSSNKWNISVHYLKRENCLISLHAIKSHLNLLMLSP